ncbi:putative DNA helicase [Tanacetum coccineum]
MAGRLFHTYVVDAYTAILDHDLEWYKRHQSTILSELYNGLHDRITNGETNMEHIGHRVVLPSTFTGGPRYMIQQYHDAMAICRWAGAPDLFVTMTCNPRWIEIARHVEDHIPGQHVNDRPDVITKMFKIKLDEHIKDIMKKHFLGRVKAYTWLASLSYHCFLHDEDKISSPEKINKFIFVGLPSKDDNPIGFEAVRTHMIHGPCGAYASDSSCIHKGECTKGFPKRYSESTYISPEGWPHYARPNNGREVSVGSRNIMIDNCYVVPHNRDLLVKYVCHINVEWCNQGSLVKYLFSYITKGSDRSTVVIESDKNNTCWKIFNYDLHYRSIVVERLSFHEENCNKVYFRDNDDPEVIAEKISSSKTKFTEWMVGNQKYPEGRSLTYVDYPTRFTWHDDIKAWKPRKSGKCIGYIYYVYSAMGEKLYLRMLLNIVRGARPHKEIRTVDSVVYPTYMATCNAYHLLGDNTEWIDTMRGGSQWQRGLQLIDLFISILLFCDVADIVNPDIVFTDEEIQNYTLLEIESVLNSGNRSLSDFLELPQIDRLILNMAGNRLIAAERMYNIENERKLFSELYSGLNYQQKDIFNNIMRCVAARNSGLLRLELLLPSGRTSHSRFCIPIDLDKDSCCAIDVTSDLAELIKVVELIIWDEAPLQHQHAFEAVDHTFRDICKDHVCCGHNKVFGGKVVVLGGDFRQILLVITNGTRFDVVTSAVNKSDVIWRNCRVYVLSINMRLRDLTLADSDVEQLRLFTNCLLDMGDGRLPAIALNGEDEASWITIPDDLLLPVSDNAIETTVAHTFPGLLNRLQDINYLKENCIPCSTNDVVDDINSHVLKNVLGELQELYSADSICPTTNNLEEMQIMYSTEFLNMLRFSGIPNHKA